MHVAVVLRLDDRLLECLTGRAADVEGAHRQLRAWFADGLRGDDADGFTEFYKIAGSQVATVTHRADAPAALACEHRANLELLDADALQLGRDRLVYVLVCFDNFFLFLHRVGNRFAAHPANDALPKIDHFFVAFVDRAHNDAVHRSAIFCHDDDVLRRIHEFAGEITGVSSFQRRIRETFPRAVSRNEVLEHAQSFAEI